MKVSELLDALKSVEPDTEVGLLIRAKGPWPEVETFNRYSISFDMPWVGHGRVIVRIKAERKRSD